MADGSVDLTWIDAVVQAGMAALGRLTRRARSVGIYRLWRDSGFAIGALTAGIPADLASIEVAIYAVAALTATSGAIGRVRMHETHRPTT